MTSKSGDLYHQLFLAYKSCHPMLTGVTCQKDSDFIWKEAKVKYGNTNEFFSFISEKIENYKIEATRKKAKQLNFFISTSQTRSHSDPSCSKNVVSSSRSHEELNANSAIDEISSISSSSHAELVDEDSPIKSKKKNVAVISSDEESEMENVENVQPPQKKSAPAQEKIKKEISLLESELNTAIQTRDAGFDNQDVTEKISKLNKKLKTKKQDLKRRETKSRLERRDRTEKKEAIRKLITTDSNLAKKLKIRDKAGRPRVEEDQPELLKTIVDIALVGSSADERRRTEKIRSIKTLDELHDELNLLGFNLSRSGTYLRLIPRDSRTSEGKRHIVTVPVKLNRAETSNHNQHPDGKFCVASIRSIKSLVSLLGPKQTAFLSQDDKACVPIGITAANKQGPLLMHVEYKVTLPDHDWIVAKRHKLIQSVYAGIVIREGKSDGSPSNVSYSGPTYIAIRSGKHSSSSASTHAFDLERIIDLPEFDELLKVNGVLKPILVVSVDGGPDENPRYPKVIAYAVDNFKKYNLDALFIFTNAPGRSAFNRVERRMAPLSRELSGLILPHDKFGNHLNSAGKTVDTELELKNFQHAGEVLAEVSNSVQIDDYPVIAEFCKSDCELSIPDSSSPEWYSLHMRESNYFLQIVKCEDITCCSSTRSDLKMILPEGFFPPPFPLRRTERGLEIPEPTDVHQKDDFPSLFLRQAINLKPLGQDMNPPYDMYCPSVLSDLQDRICKVCGLYFAAKSHLVPHQVLYRNERREQRTSCQNEIESLDKISLLNCNTVEKDNEVSTQTTIIETLSEWLIQPWTISETTEDEA